MKQQHAATNTFPYTAARVRARKAKLLTKQDYHKLLKLDLNGITKQLQDTEYRDSVTKLSTEYEGTELIDMALRRNLYRSFNRLREISPDSVVSVIDLYLDSFDFQNLKVVLRGIYNQASQEEVVPSIEPVGKHRKEYFTRLCELNDIWKVLEEADFVRTKDLEEAYKQFRESGQLVELENQLDRIYFNNAMEGSKQLVSHGKQFRRFLLTNIDITNITNLLRMKHQEMEADRTLHHVICDGLRIKVDKLRELAHSDSYSSLIKKLQHTYYHEFIKFSEEDDLFHLEMRMQKFLMSHSVKSYGNPMSIGVILEYMIRKIIEIKNLRVIIKSKYLGISPEYCEQHLLIL